MFRAVRHWWSGGRGRHTVRLFFFELFVVILGVLIAQGLAEWAQDRAASARMEDARTAVLDEVGRADNVAHIWQNAAPCLDERMSEIMRLASDGRPIPSEMLRRPKFRVAIMHLPDENDLLLLRNRYGQTDPFLIGRVVDSATNLNQRSAAIAAAWQGLFLVDPANGMVGAADREEARKSAAAIKIQLVGIRINAGAIRDDAEQLGKAGLRDPGALPIRRCEDLWRGNSTFIDLERSRR